MYLGGDGDKNVNEHDGKFCIFRRFEGKLSTFQDICKMETLQIN